MSNGDTLNICLDQGHLDLILMPVEVEKQHKSKQLFVCFAFDDGYKSETLC